MKQIGMKLSEKQIETQILNFLERTPGCSFHKLNNVGIFDTKRKTFRTVQNKYIPKGISDIFGSFYNHTTWIEVKTPEEHAYILKHYEELKRHVPKPLAPGAKKSTDKKLHYRNQIEFIESKKRIGDIAFFACSVEMVERFLIENNKKIIKGE